MRLYVYKAPWILDQDLVELIMILEAQGFEVIVIEAFADQTVAADVVFAPGDEVLVIMVPGCNADSQLMALSERVSRAGCRVIGIWPKSAEGEQSVASALEWHGSAVVPWSPQRIRDAVGGEDVWETPMGARRASPHTERHKC